MIYHNGNKIIKAYKGEDIINNITDYVSGNTPTSRLPEGYTEVEYVENTGQSIVNLGIQLMVNSSNSFQVELDNEMTWTTGGEQFQTFLSAQITYASPYNGWCYYYKDNVLKLEGNITNFTTARTLVSGSIYHSVATCSNVANKTNSAPLCLFGAYDSTNTPYRFCKGKLYSLTAILNGSLVANLVPCINPSNVVGVYNLVNDTFYTSDSGYDSLVAGNPVTPTGSTSESKVVFQYITSGDAPTPPSPVPAEYTELQWFTVPKTTVSGSYSLQIPYELQPYYKYSIDFTPINFWTNSYYAFLLQDTSNGDAFQIFKLDNGWGGITNRMDNALDNYNFDTRRQKPLAGQYGVYENVRAKITMYDSGYTSGNGGVIIVENEGMSTYSGVTTGTRNTGYTANYGVGNLYTFCLPSDYKQTPNMKFHNFKVEDVQGNAIYDYRPVTRISDSKVGLFDTIHQEFYYPTAYTLTAGDPVT